MTTNFNGFNEKVLTFDCDTKIIAGMPVKLSADGKVVAAAAGDRFIGICVYSKCGHATVQVEGYVTLPYSSTAPTVNHTKFVADGVGGVKVDTNGSETVVLCVDTTAKTVGFIM